MSTSIIRSLMPRAAAARSGTQRIIDVTSPDACDLRRPNVNQDFPPDALPVIVPACGADTVVESGRGTGFGVITTPRELFWGAWLQASNSSPRSTLKASGPYAGVNLPLTLALPAPTGSNEGERAYVYPMMLEVGLSNQVAAGDVTGTLAGYFADGNAFSQSFELTVGRNDRTARFYMVPTQVVAGGAYPALVELNSGRLVTPASAIALTPAAAPNDATSITVTNGLRMPVRTLVCTITSANVGMQFTYSMLTPVSTKYREAMRAYSEFVGGQ